MSGESPGNRPKTTSRWAVPGGWGLGTRPRDKTTAPVPGSRAETPATQSSSAFLACLFHNFRHVSVAIEPAEAVAAARDPRRFSRACWVDRFRERRHIRTGPVGPWTVRALSPLTDRNRKSLLEIGQRRRIRRPGSGGCLRSRKRGAKMAICCCRMGSETAHSRFNVLLVSSQGPQTAGDHDPEDSRTSVALKLATPSMIEPFARSMGYEVAPTRRPSSLALRSRETVRGPRCVGDVS